MVGSEANCLCVVLSEQSRPSPRRPLVQALPNEKHAISIGQIAADLRDRPETP